MRDTATSSQPRPSASPSGNLHSGRVALRAQRTRAPAPLLHGSSSAGLQGFSLSEHFALCKMTCLPRSDVHKSKGRLVAYSAPLTDDFVATVYCFAASSHVSNVVQSKLYLFSFFIFLFFCGILISHDSHKADAPPPLSIAKETDKASCIIFQPCRLTASSTIRRRT